MLIYLFSLYKKERKNTFAFVFIFALLLLSCFSIAFIYLFFCTQTCFNNEPCRCPRVSGERGLTHNDIMHTFVLLILIFAAAQKRKENVLRPQTSFKTRVEQKKKKSS